MLWSMYYNIPSCLVCSESVELPHNFYVTCGPYFELDYDESVKQVRFYHIFAVSILFSYFQSFVLG